MRAEAARAPGLGLLFLLLLAGGHVAVAAGGEKPETVHFDPGPTKQSGDANRGDGGRDGSRAERFFRAHLGP